VRGESSLSIEAGLYRFDCDCCCWRRIGFSGGEERMRGWRLSEAA
jgi:hypothetical protein